MTISCIIIDDEQPAREELSFLLSGFPDIQILDQADTVSKAIKSIRQHHPNFILLDIQMPGRNGFDVLPEIKDLNPPPLVIFITAYDQYAVKAFEENAIDYIMKPFSEKRFEQSLNKVRDLLALENTRFIRDQHEKLVQTTSKLNRVKKIPVERSGRLLLLNLDKIMFCQYNDKKISVHTDEDTFSLYGIQSMDQLEVHLKPFSFFRSHRNTIINFDYIKEFTPWFHGKYHLTMKDKKSSELIIPRERVKLFKEHLGI